jgi:hypothetical protein
MKINRAINVEFWIFDERLSVSYDGLWTRLNC